MAEKFKVIIAKADSRRLIVNEEFEHTLENMQEIVGGLIEAVSIDGLPGSDRAIDIWVNEEGLIHELPPNICLIRETTNEVETLLVGDALITAVNKKGETIGLTDEEINYFVSKVRLNIDEKNTIKAIMI